MLQDANGENTHLCNITQQMCWRLLWVIIEHKGARRKKYIPPTSRTKQRPQKHIRQPRAHSSSSSSRFNKALCKVMLSKKKREMTRFRASSVKPKQRPEYRVTMGCRPVPSLLMPTLRHFLRRQYWHWLRWCWSTGQFLLALQE